jgi:dihydroorotate dehydrogenase electron transfer subunit
MDYITAEIIQVLRPTPEYGLIRFKAERPVEGVPGQFVMIRGKFGNDPILPRAFSLVESGKTGAVLVRAVGKATHLLLNLQSGDPLTVLGPLGNGFSLPEKDSYPVLVAGGVGTAPLIFLAEALYNKGMESTFIYGGRTVKDLVFQGRIARSSTLLMTTEDGSAGVQGRVTDVLDTALKNRSKVTLYACGPEAMLKALADIARTKGTPLEVALEQAMACGMGTCKGCAVHAADGKFRYVCSDGPVFDAQAIFGGAK